MKIKDILLSTVIAMSIVLSGCGQETQSISPANTPNAESASGGASSAAQAEPGDGTDGAPGFGPDSVRVEGTQGVEVRHLSDWFDSLTVPYEDAIPGIIEQCATEWGVKTDADGNPMKTFTGHTVYTGKAITGAYGYDPGTIFDFIVSGNDIIPVVGDMYGNFDIEAINPDALSMLYDENGKRVYVLDTQEEIDEAKYQWEQGQKVLNGELKPEEGSVVLDGRLLQKTKWVEHEYAGGYGIEMSNLVDEMLNQSYADHFESCVYIWSQEGGSIWESAETIPARDYQDTYNIFKFDKDYKFSMQVREVDEMWGDGFEGSEERYFVLYGLSYIGEAKMLVDAFGWEITVEDGVMYIVTDETNVSDNFILMGNNGWVSL